ncbi:MAG: VCBS repeat-containing protein [Bacteroidota bacterium]|nr:VCBS repeat-containing protein [Bacteroidota bacterium]
MKNLFRGLVLALLEFCCLNLALGQTLSPPSQRYVLEFSSYAPAEGGQRIAFAPSSKQISLGSQFTLETWLYLDTTTNVNFIVGKQLNGVLYGLSIDPQTGLLTFSQSTGTSTQQISSSSPVPLKTWTHIAGTLTQDTLRLYINGTQEASGTSPGIPQDTGVVFSIGSYLQQDGTSLGNPGFRGALCQVRVWNRALTGSELHANAVRYLQGNENGLVAYWPLDDGGGQVAHDLGPNKLHLQLGLTPDLDLTGFLSPSHDPQWVHSTVLSLLPFFSQEMIQPPNDSAWLGRIYKYWPIDFNSDGNLDLVAAAGHGGQGQLWPLLALQNDGSGHFTDVTSQVFSSQDTLMETPRKAVVADFNGDGRQDIYFANTGYDFGTNPQNDPRNLTGGQSRIYIQTPDGRLSDETSTRIPSEIAFRHWSTAGDIDGDGDVDIYTSGFNVINAPYPYAWGAYVNNGSGVFARDTTRISLPYLTQNFESCLLVDVNKDGYPDLVLGYGTKGADHTSDVLLMNDGKGNFSRSVDLPPLYFPNGGTGDIETADFNNDGWPDLLIFCYQDQQGFQGNGGGGSRLQLFLNNGDGSFRDASNQIPQEWPQQGGWGLGWVLPVDINNDGLVDIVVSASAGVVPRVYLNTGSANFVDASEILPDIYPPAPMSVGDFDNDEKKDLVFFSNGGFLLRNLKLADKNLFSQQPLITSVYPTAASAGTQVTISGANFCGTTDVKFNGKSAPSYLVSSDSVMTATVPEQASSGAITVISKGGISSGTGSTSLVVPLTIYDFHPKTGPTGTLVTISGSSFTGTSDVKFGGVSTSSFSVVADSEIVVTVPAGAVSGPISVTGPVGTVTTSSGFVAINPPPQDYVLDFPQGSQIATAPLSPLLNLDSSFTMEAWVYLQSGVTNPVAVVGRAYDGGSQGLNENYALRITDQDRPELIQTLGVPMTGRSATASSGIPLNKWTHIAGTLGNDTLKLCINGDEVASIQSPGTPVVSTLPFSIGADAGPNSSVYEAGFKGALRQVMVWSRALSQREIQANASVNVANSDSGLIAYWPLDDSTGQTARDLGPNHLDLVLGNTTGADSYDPSWILTNLLTPVSETYAKLPKEFRLQQNYPNPFNPSTTIRYGLPLRSQIKIEVFNILGQVIKILTNGVQDAGYHQVVWNAAVSSGIYFYRITATPLSGSARSFVDVRKMLLLR